MTMKERVEASIVLHRRILNQLETHLGCVVCRGPLTDGRCIVCDPQEETP